VEAQSDYSAASSSWNSLTDSFAASSSQNLLTSVVAGFSQNPMAGWLWQWKQPHCLSMSSEKN